MKKKVVFVATLPPNYAAAGSFTLGLFTRDSVRARVCVCVLLLLAELFDFCLLLLVLLEDDGLDCVIPGADTFAVARVVDSQVAGVHPDLVAFE
jgi:hypothetical protein